MNNTKFCVAVCDDDMECIQHLEKMIDTYFKSAHIAYKIFRFHSGADLLEACRSNSVSAIHLLFLDIEMEKMSGIEVKEQLSGNTVVKRLVFVTSHEEAMPMAFGVRVIGFVKKPISYEQTARWIEVVRKELKNAGITYQSDAGIRAVSQDEILYIEAAGDYTYLYRVYSDEPELVNHNVRYWERLLKELPFVRVHKSFLVNIEYITKMKNNTVSLKHSRDFIPIGRAYKKQAEESFHSYILEMVRNRTL